jgi:hypothetical protein
MFAHLLTIDEVALALEDLKKISHPPQHIGRGYKDPELDVLFRNCLKGMKQFMWTYINPNSGTMGKWQGSSLKTADNLQKGPAHAQKLCQWVREYVEDCEDLLVNPYGQWNESVIDKDPVLAQEIHAHLQGIGKYVKAMDLVNFMDTPEMREQTGLKKRIDVSTVQRWMKKLDYCWTYTPKGQYIDGHKREDIVVYRQKIFLPRWANIKARTRDRSNGQLKLFHMSGMLSFDSMMSPHSMPMIVE